MHSWDNLRIHETTMLKLKLMNEGPPIESGGQKIKFRGYHAQRYTKRISEFGCKIDVWVDSFGYSLNSDKFHIVSGILMFRFQWTLDRMQLWFQIPIQLPAENHWFCLRCVFWNSNHRINFHIPLQTATFDTSEKHEPIWANNDCTNPATIESESGGRQNLSSYDQGKWLCIVIRSLMGQVRKRCVTRWNLVFVTRMTIVLYQLFWDNFTIWDNLQLIFWIWRWLDVLSCLRSSWKQGRGIL